MMQEAEKKGRNTEAGGRLSENWGSKFTPVEMGTRDATANLWAKMWT